jgi:hypothetical protein
LSSELDESLDVLEAESSEVDEPLDVLDVELSETTAAGFSDGPDPPVAAAAMPPRTRAATPTPSRIGSVNKRFMKALLGWLFRPR